MNTAAFTLDAIRQQQQQTGCAWSEFLAVPTLSMGVYTIAAGSNDRETHTPHDRDEVYVGLSGTGKLTADGETFDVSTNSVVFVKAGVVHWFHDVVDDLTVLVFFAGESS